MMRAPLGLAIVAMLFVGLGAGYFLGHRQSQGGSRGASVSGRDFKQLSTEELGATLMAKVGERFVADDRPREPSDGIGFYDTPKPFGHWLCRVNRYWIPAKTITGKTKQVQDYWEDDLSVRTGYAAWTTPTPKMLPDSARREACRKFRGFSQLFIVDEPSDPERAVYLLDAIIKAVRSGEPLPFRLTCTKIQIADDSRHACNGREPLRDMSLQHLFQVRMISEREFGRGKIYEHQLMLGRAQSGSYEDMGVIVVSDEKYGRYDGTYGVIRSVDVTYGS